MDKQSTNKDHLLVTGNSIHKPWEEKGTAEDETVGWHHRLNEHESEQVRETVKPGVLQSMGSQRVGHN